MSDLDDLVTRLEEAGRHLTGLANRPAIGGPERARLMSKREGVTLALSYAREYLRGGAA